MNRGRDEGRQLGLEELAALLRDAKGLTQQPLRRRRAEADDDLWLDVGDLCLKPRPAGARLVLVRLVVESPLARDVAGPLPLEVLDHVRDVDGFAVDTCLDQRPVEQLS